MKRYVPEPLSRSLVKDSFAWGGDIKGQIVNPDIDGLLSACLLHEQYDWPIVGFYDNKRLWLDSTVPLPLDLDHLVWVDCDMLIPGARCISQHVTMRLPSDRTAVEAFNSTINPNLFSGNCQDRGYTTKYPAGTFQWVWWVTRGGQALPDLANEIQTGLAWMPDGPWNSVTGRHTENILRWALDVLPGNILQNLAAEIRSNEHPKSEGRRARRYVQQAATKLAAESASLLDQDWPSLQFSMTRSCQRRVERGKGVDGIHPGPEVRRNPPDHISMLTRLLAGICNVYGWQGMPALPSTWRELSGVYWITSAMPPGWPECAGTGRLASLAVTQEDEVRWTSLGKGTGSLEEAFTPIKAGRI